MPAFLHPGRPGRMLRGNGINEPREMKDTSASPVLRDIVLVGGGHSHVVVLRRFAMAPVPGVRLTLICRDTHTPYSGMLPGYIAGHYSYDDVHIDLRRLAEFAGARYLHDEVVGIDRAARTVLCRNRPPVPYDWASVNIGSTPHMGDVQGATEHAVPVKPIFNFNRRWLMLLERIRTHEGPLRVVVVGGGAGGVEMTLAMQYRLQHEMRRLGRPESDVQFTLITRSPVLLPTHNARVRRYFSETLVRRGVTVRTGEGVQTVEAGAVITERQEVIPCDEVLWVTQAGGADWLKQTGLALDERGFIRVTDTLQSETDPRIFAAGDVASMIHHPREKAGVFAVRMGRPLADNLRRSALGVPLKPYRPQKHWLALISTGDRYAVASRGPIGFAGGWVWRWKDWIDRRFMQRFSDLPAMGEDTPPPPPLPLDDAEKTQAISAVAMRCGGCGAKVGSTVLSRALEQVHPIDRDDVLVGLKAPDDAAVVRVPEGMAAVHSIDFFRAFIDDPWVFGKIAANHSLGDLFAMGATPQTATAVATVPPGLERKVEDTLRDMMGGAVEVLNAAGCALVGGHTGEGRELALGFAVNGYIDPEKILPKGGLKPGQRLILTKPLGTGTLFAALKTLRIKGRWIDDALDSMCVSNQQAASILREYGVTACTDVTGFGLLGHLVEMTRPSGVDAEIWLDRLPVLEGAEETLAAGVQSSLAPSNVRLRRALKDQARWVNHPRYGLLFDPQTAGGLLASVPAQQAQACLEALQQAGYRQARIIGAVRPQGDALEPVHLRDSAPD